MGDTGEEEVVHKSTFAVLYIPCLSPETTEKVLKGLNGNYTQVVITVMIFFALFGDDFRLTVCPKSADDVFQVITILCLVVFFLELMINFVCLPEWRFGFYFWLDAVATVSLIFDITWITDALADASSDDTDAALEDAIEDEGNGDENSAAALKAGRASRAGTKAGRIVRVVRLIRLVRIVKLYKQREKLKGNDIADSAMPIYDVEPSKVGKKLTELTTIRIIILILMMILILPFIDNSSINSPFEYQAQLTELQELHHIPQDLNETGTFITEEYLERRTQEYASRVGYTILDISIVSFQDQAKEWLSAENEKESSKQWDTNFLELPTITETFREEEYIQVDAFGCFGYGTETEKIIGNPELKDSDTSCYSRVMFDVQADQQYLAGLNMLKTCFIMFLLGVAIIFITRDAETLVIVPIERMMILVKNLADNPLGKTKVDDPLGDEGDADHAKEEGYETAMLEQTLSKIGGLLQVGFGVAGSEIIGENMGSAGGLNVLLPGRKITTVVVFGIIEDFTETCSCLGESICTYINTIAAIVHGGAHNWFGAANKNIGSAFLLVWKLCNGCLPGLRDPRDGDDVPRRPPKEIEAERKSMTVSTIGCGRRPATLTIQSMVDSSLIAVLKMCVDIHNGNKSTGTLYSFCRNSKMVESFGDHYKVGLGFGMHIGWAIEGAIGSKYKVDASYLSPNVNMSARLEAATHMYGVQVLLSEWFVGELSPAVLQHCRRLDKVTVKGSQVPMELWTFDITSYPAEFAVPELDDTGAQLPPPLDEAGSIFNPLKEGLAHGFVELFAKGVDAYLAGQWSEAMADLEKASALTEGGDKPSQLLLRVMKSKDFQAPSTWRGFRELTSKT